MPPNNNTAAQEDIYNLRIPALVAVEPRDGLKIWVKYDDGIEGELDLAHLAEKRGVFKAWDDRAFFESVYIDLGVVTWGHFPNEIDLAPETGYAVLLGISREQIRDMDLDEFYTAIILARRARKPTVNA